MDAAPSTEKLLQACSYRLGQRGRVWCRLWRIERDRRCRCRHFAPTYVIGLEGVGMSYRCRLGSDAELAYALYEKLVRCRASPCTLQDVVDDFRCE